REGEKERKRKRQEEEEKRTTKHLLQERSKKGMKKRKRKDIQYRRWLYILPSDKSYTIKGCYSILPPRMMSLLSAQMNNILKVVNGAQERNERTYLEA